MAASGTGSVFAPAGSMGYGRAAPMQSSRTPSSLAKLNAESSTTDGDEAAPREPIVAEVEADARAEEEAEGDDAPSSHDGALVPRREAPISRPGSSARGAVRISGGVGPRISIVIPALNESESLPELEQRIREALTGKEDYEIIFVDDGSTDDTWKCIGRMVDASPHVRGVKLRKNFGKAMGLTAGFSRARGDIVIMMDADLQDDPAELPKFIEKVDEGFDVVVGWKVKRLDPANRLILTRIFNGTVRWVTGVKLHDMNCGFKAYSRDVIRTVPIYGDLFRFIPALAAWEGFRVTEVPVHHHSRKHGVSRYGLERIMRGSFDLLTIAFLTKYSRRPMHLFGLFGALLGFVGLVINLYLTVLWFRGESIGHRPLLLLGSTLFLAGLQFVSVGVLGEFLTYLHQKRIRPTDLPIREEVDATSGLHRPGRSTLG
jgi:glycosyltransferase involved in cell wall biosynthesis